MPLDRAVTAISFWLRVLD